MKNLLIYKILVTVLALIPTLGKSAEHSREVFSPDEIKIEIAKYIGNYSGMIFERSSSAQNQHDSEFEPGHLSIALKNGKVNVLVRVNQVCRFSLEDFQSMGLTDGIVAPKTMYALFYATDNHCFEGAVSGVAITLFFYPKEHRVILHLEKSRSSTNHRYVTIVGDFEKDR